MSSESAHNNEKKQRNGRKKRTNWREKFNKGDDVLFLNDPLKGEQYPKEGLVTDLGAASYGV